MLAFRIDLCIIKSSSIIIRFWSHLILEMLKKRSMLVEEASFGYGYKKFLGFGYGYGFGYNKFLGFGYGLGIQTQTQTQNPKFFWVKRLVQTQDTTQIPIGPMR